VKIEKYVEHMDVKVEEYEVELVPPQYEYFNNSGMVTSPTSHITSNSDQFLLTLG